MSLLPGIRAELAAAARAVSAAYSRLEGPRPPFDVAAWDRLGDEVADLCAHGNRDEAMARIEQWQAAVIDSLPRRVRS